MLRMWVQPMRVTEKKEHRGDEYAQLAYAIVMQAVADYKNVHKCKRRWVRESREKMLIDFFHSEWCYELCGIDASTWDRVIAEINKNRDKKKKGGA
jgi:hypothetical protein